MRAEPDRAAADRVIVYGDRERQEDARDVLSRARSAARRAAHTLGHDEAVDLLVECGELEAAVADVLMPLRERQNPSLEPFSQATVAAARLLRGCWRGGPQREDGREAAHACQRALARAAVPQPVLRTRASEGFAWYGLHPEAYLAAAARLDAEAGPGRVLCIGVRGIGAALSAAVAAELEARGREVARITVRPHGHPFDRRVTIEPGLAAELRAWGAAHVAIADEGPGLSGSSLAAAAEAVESSGVTGGIALMPAWAPEPASLGSLRARERFARHRVYAASAEETVVTSGGLARALRVRVKDDLSAGRWRGALGALGVAVQPQHERGKLLCEGPAGEPLLAKFAGFGRYGRATLARAERLAESGTVPRPRALAHGYLLSAMPAGTPLVRGAFRPADALAVAEHLAHVSRRFGTGRAARWDGLAPMVRANVDAVLGPEWVPRLEGLAPAEAEAVALDARVLAHEWIRAPGGLVKTDATDHWDDHFFPGPADPAWDLAAAGEELGLPAAGRAALAERYADLSGDAAVAMRVRPYAVAYLAFRAGYATLAVRTLAGSAEEPRWRAEQRRYASALRAALA